jgi:hypothetical protein
MLHLFKYNNQQSNDGVKSSMKNISKITKGAILILLSGMLLAACSAGAPATPTTDPNATFTQVAETVMVSISQTAAAMPTNTPAPTNTPTPTPMPLPTEDMNAIPTSQPVLPGYPTPTVQRFGNAAQWYGQSPADGLTYTANQKFNFHGCMRNIGTTTWNNNFYLKIVGSTASYNPWGGTVIWRVGGSVIPGSPWCWDFNAGTMPASKGTYISWINFYSNKDEYIAQLYFKYTVTG